MTDITPRDPGEVRVSLRTEAKAGGFPIVARDGSGVLQTVMLDVICTEKGVPPWEPNGPTESFTFAFAPPDALAIAQRIIELVEAMPKQG